MKKLHIGLVIFSLLLPISSNGLTATKKAAQPSVIEYIAKRNSAKQTAAKKKTTRKVRPKNSATANVAAPAITAPMPCVFTFNDVSDERRNKQTIGMTFTAALRPEGIDQWLKDAKADLWDKHWKPGSEGKAITVNPRLTRLYSYAQGMNLHSVVALTVDYVSNGEVVQTRRYRGFGSKMNMWNAVSEYYDVASYSAHDAFPKVLQDLPSVCDAVK